MTDADTCSSGPAAGYYCRGCGGLLSEGGKAHFHPECLRSDKQRRVAEHRRLETERRQAWLKRQRCPACGASLGKLTDTDLRRPVEDMCEPSQGPQRECELHREG